MHLFLLNFMPLMIAQRSSLSRSLCKASCPSRVNSTSQFGIISKLANSAFSSCIQIIDTEIEQNWAENRALRNTDGGWLPARCSPVNYNPLSSALQPVLHPAHSVPAHSHLDDLSRRMLWGTLSKALIKSRRSKCPIFPSSSRQVTLL